MSLLSKILKKVAPIAATAGSAIPGIGTTVAGIGSALSAYYGARSGASTAMDVGIVSPPAALSSLGMAGLSFGGLGKSLTGAGVARVGGAVLRGGVAGAKRIYQSAATYCRKHPGWCQTIGGIAAAEALVRNGQLPIIKARRGRGITATELRHFKRVARFTSKYCAPVRRAMKAPAMHRRTTCR